MKARLCGISQPPSIQSVAESRTPSGRSRPHRTRRRTRRAGNACDSAASRRRRRRAGCSAAATGTGATGSRVPRAARWRRIRCAARAGPRRQNAVIRSSISSAESTRGSRSSALAATALGASGLPTPVFGLEGRATCPRWPRRRLPGPACELTASTEWLACATETDYARSACSQRRRRAHAVGRDATLGRRRSSSPRSSMPLPLTARLPRCIRCQSWAQPSTAEYWHIGDTTTRFGSVTA